MKTFLITIFSIFALHFGLAQTQWHTIEEAIEIQKTEPNKKMFIDVYADWCGPCKLLDSETFGNAQVADSLNKYFIPVKMNAEKQKDFVFNGRKYELLSSSDGRKMNLFVYLAFQNLGFSSYPTCLFVNSEGQITNYTRGYLQPEQILPVLIENK